MKGKDVTRRFISGATIALLLCVTAPAIGQDKKPGDVKQSDDAKSTVGAKSSKVRRVEGVVKSVEADGFVVSGKEKNKDRDWAFAITDKTTMTRADKAAVAGDLKPGDAVTVDYVQHDGKVIAQTVIVKAAGRAVR